LRPRNARQDRERGSARGQMQDVSTVRKFQHGVLPASPRNARLDAQYLTMEVGRSPIAPVLPIAMIRDFGTSRS
jgi:hypothetical protein